MLLHTDILRRLSSQKIALYPIGKSELLKGGTKMQEQVILGFVLFILAVVGVFRHSREELNHTDERTHLLVTFRSTLTGATVGLSKVITHGFQLSKAAAHTTVMALRQLEEARSDFILKGFRIVRLPMNKSWKILAEGESQPPLKRWDPMNIRSQVSKAEYWLHEWANTTIAEWKTTIHCNLCNAIGVSKKHPCQVANDRYLDDNWETSTITDTVNDWVDGEMTTREVEKTIRTNTPTPRNHQGERAIAHIAKDLTSADVALIREYAELDHDYTGRNLLSSVAAEVERV